MKAFFQGLCFTAGAVLMLHLLGVKLPKKDEKKD